MKQVQAYTITCLTNMHVGAGGTNYDVIDNMVQRDAVSEIPTINSSSLKGALREFFFNQWEEDEKLNHIFGKQDGIGHYNFFAADLLSLPVRAKNKAHYNATSPFLLDRVNTLAQTLGLSTLIENNDSTTEGKPKTAGGNDLLEDWKAEAGLSLSNEHIGKDIALFADKDFKRLAKKLPVIARNKLENGESKNLFYEEVVPRETRFVMFIANDGKHVEAFEKALTENVVQIGANGSIGYGFCKITKIG